MIVDRSGPFKQHRSLVHEWKSLENLVIERRFEKLRIWLQTQANTNATSPLTYRRLKDFEKAIVHWENDGDVSNCRICDSAFTFFNRKHHCRICGRVVCADLRMGCSMLVPIAVLQEILGISTSETRVPSELALRICIDCKRSGLNRRLFEMDQRKASNAPFVHVYNNWKLLHEKVESEDMTTIRDEGQNVKLVTLFSKLEKLISHIDELKSSVVEVDGLKILDNLRTVIIGYIKAKLPILRKAQDTKLAKERELLQNIINGKPKLSKREIRLKREKLMVLNEQKFLVQEMYQELKKHRRFDDLKSLDENLHDIDIEIKKITEELGDEAF